jgi:hypothetical protein
MGLEGQVIPQQSFYSIIYLTVLLVEVAVKISNFFKINLGLDSLIINMDEHKLQFSVKSTKTMR